LGALFRALRQPDPSVKDREYISFIQPFFNLWCSFAFGKKTKSNILFSVSDLERSIELDNGPFGTGKIGVCFG